MGVWGNVQSLPAWLDAKAHSHANRVTVVLCSVICLRTCMQMNNSLVTDWPG
jgi:hypothetical protein